MEDFFQTPGLFDLGILIVDARHKPTADDVRMAAFFRETESRFLVVANKTDKLKKSEFEPNLQLIRETLSMEEGEELIPYSALRGEGRDLLRARLLQLA